MASDLIKSFGFNRKKKFVRPQHSLDRLRGEEVTPHTVCVSLPNLKSQRKYEKNVYFAALFP